jgi:hypothetical protein
MSLGTNIDLFYFQVFSFDSFNDDGVDPILNRDERTANPEWIVLLVVIVTGLVVVVVIIMVIVKTFYQGKV